MANVPVAVFWTKLPQTTEMASYGQTCVLAMLVIIVCAKEEKD